MSDGQDRCMKCNHAWGAHQRLDLANQGPRWACRYSSFANHRCGCSEADPSVVAREKRAAAAWNSYMGREPRNMSDQPATRMPSSR